MRASIRPDTSAWKGMVSTCLLVATWLCVNIPSLQWLFHSFKQASHFNLILMRLFYGVEAPLFLLCLIRLFVLRELTPASTQILGTVVVCVATFFLELLYGYATRHRPRAWLQMLAHSLMLLVGLYLGAVLMF